MMMAELTLKDIYSRLDALASDAHKVACSLEIGDERTEAFALYTVLHRLLRRGAAVHIHDAINPLLVDHNSIDLTAEQYKALAQEMAPDLNRSAISDQTDIPANSLLATLAMSSLTEEDWPQHFYAATQSTRDIDGVGAVYLSEGVPDRVVENGIMRWNYYLVGKWRANVTVPVAADADEGYVAREAWLEARARLRSNKEIKASQ